MNDHVVNSYLIPQPDIDEHLWNPWSGLILAKTVYLFSENFFWVREQITAILLTFCRHSFSCVEVNVFRLKFHRIIPPWVQLIMCQHGSDNGWRQTVDQPLSESMLATFIDVCLRHSSALGVLTWSENVMVILTRKMPRVDVGTVPSYTLLPTP